VGIKVAVDKGIKYTLLLLAENVFHILYDAIHYCMKKDTI
jgi:hypothetical protein